MCLAVNQVTMTELIGWIFLTQRLSIYQNKTCHIILIHFKVSMSILIVIFRQMTLCKYLLTPIVYIIKYNPVFTKLTHGASIFSKMF